MPDKINIIELDIKQEDVVKKLADISAQMKALKDATGLTSEEIEINKAQLKTLSQEYGNNQKVLVNLTASENQELGTLQKLSLSNKTLRAEQQKLNLDTKKGAERNKEIVKEIDKNTASIKAHSDSLVKDKMNVGNYKSALEGLPGPFGSVVSGIKGMVAASKAFIATPIGAILAALALVIGGLVKIFKVFDPLVDKIQQGVAGLTAGLTFLKESVIALFTRQEKLNGSMRDAVKAGIELKKSQQELDDMNWKLIESDAKYKRQIDELLLQSKDRTKSEKERIALINEALKIEEQAYNERKAVAIREQEIAQNKIIIGRGLTEQEIANIKELGVAYAISLKDKRGISDQEILNLANANAKIETVLNESVMIREKAVNRQNVIIEKQEEEAEKRKESELERIKELADAEKLRLEQLEALNIARIQAEMEMRDVLAELDSEMFNNFETGILENSEKYQAAIEARKQWDAEYAAYKIALDETTKNATLDVMAKLAGSMASLFGEQTKIGRAAAVAETTINTYASATAAFKSMASIPVVGPILGGVAAGAAIIAGVANVKKILSVKSGLPKDSGGGGSVPSATSVSMPKPTASQLSYAGNDVIASRNNNQFTGNNNQPAQSILVVDQVTAKQKSISSVQEAAIA